MENKLLFKKLDELIAMLEVCDLDDLKKVIDILGKKTFEIGKIAKGLKPLLKSEKE